MTWDPPTSMDGTLLQLSCCRNGKVLCIGGRPCRVARRGVSRCSRAVLLVKRSGKPSRPICRALCSRTGARTRTCECKGSMSPRKLMSPSTAHPRAPVELCHRAWCQCWCQPRAMLPTPSASQIHLPRPPCCAAPCPWPLKLLSCGPALVLPLPLLPSSNADLHPIPSPSSRSKK